MVIPLLELAGTWEEIQADVPGFANKRLYVIVAPVEESAPPQKDTRPMAEVLAELAAQIPPEESAKLPADFTDQLDHYVYGMPKK